MICNDEDTDGRARVTTDEERVLYAYCNSLINIIMLFYISKLRHLICVAIAQFVLIG